MARLVEERLFGGLQPDGWHYLPVRKLRQRRTRRKPKIAKIVGFDESIVEEPEPAEDVTRRIDALEPEGYALRAKVNRLQEARKSVISQREQWKARALAAEALLKSARDLRSKGTDRFDALRRSSPRNCTRTTARVATLKSWHEREFFKRLWPEIEQLMGRT